MLGELKQYINALLHGNWHATCGQENSGFKHWVFPILFGEVQKKATARKF